GGWTSHTFILARELEIPAVTGLRKLMRRISSGNRAVVDAYTGTVIINPTEQTIDKYANTTKQPRSADTVSEKFPAG
ncbi:PEP-utilizing enzyme, partial [Escherichia coli]|nr:PEP-utilizing enzyme [Escherichia coli]